jgi:hypothetical protein
MQVFGFQYVFSEGKRFLPSFHPDVKEHLTCSGVGPPCSGVGPQEAFDIVDVTIKNGSILTLKTRFLTPKRGF